MAPRGAASLFAFVALTFMLRNNAYAADQLCEHHASVSLPCMLLSFHA
jgi:hypothetical protein